MARNTYVFRNGECVLKEDATPLDVTGLYVISDTMDATINHADGKRYDSKAKFRRATKDAGCIEVGNEKITPKGPRTLKMDKRERIESIQKAIYDLRNGIQRQVNDPWGRT